MRLPIVCAVLLLLVCVGLGRGGETKDNKKKKSVLDYTDKDLELLAKQWEDDDEEDDEDNYPPRPKPQAPFDPQKLPSGKEGVEAMMKQSKKGQTLMTFVKIGDNPTKRETEDLTARWEESLRNGGIQAQRYIISDDRAIFMLQDGSEAWKMKDFLIQQDGCVEVEIDKQKFPGNQPRRILSKKSEL